MTDAAEAANACALCGRAGAPVYEGLRDRLFDAEPDGPDAWRLLACPSCSLVWLDPMPAPGAVADLYDHYYTHEDDPDGSSARDGPLQRAVTRGIPALRMGYPEAPATDWLERLLARGLGYLEPLREVAEHAVMWLPVAQRGRLLDVGCGAGALLERMRDFGWQVSGVEPDPAARAVATRRLGADTSIVASLEDESLEVGGYDAVTLSHVIEHVPDPVATLRRCGELLAPGGLLVCVTPNTASLGARVFRQSWLHWDPPRHLHLFDAATLERAFRDARLEIHQIATPGSTAHFVWQASVLLERNERLPGARVSGVSPALWLESVAFWTLEWLLVRLGRHVGEEVLVIGEKARA